MNEARESEVPRAPRLAKGTGTQAAWWQDRRQEGGGEREGVAGVGFVRPRQWSRGQSPRRYRLSQLLHGFRTRRTGRQKMRSAAVCIAFVLTCTSGSFVAGLRYINPQAGNNGDIGDKRLDLTEPSCDELRAMWRYTKRQNRAAKTTNGYPMYPFNPNIWPRTAMFSDRTKLSREYTRDNVAPTRLKLREELEGRHIGRPRSRAAGGAPIYGRMVHKAPAGSRWRSAMREPSRLKIENFSQHFGIEKPYVPNNRRTSFRVGGGSSSQVPQSGSFEALKNLIQAERARELQEQHIAEEIIAKAYRDGKDLINEEQLLNKQQLRKHFFNPLPLLEMTPKVNYDYNQRRYNNPPNIGQAWSRSGPLSREYMLP